jgi:AraC family transcriptional regulator
MQGSPVEGHVGTTLRAYRDLDGLSLAEVHYAPGFAMGVHSHPQAYLSIALGGAYTEQLDGARRVCEEGTVVLRPAGEPHASRFHDRPSRCLRVRLAEEWLARLPQALLPGRSIVATSGKARSLGAQLHGEFLDLGFAADLAIEGLTLALLAELVRPPQTRERGAPAWLRPVLDRIHAEFRSSLRLVDLAGTAGVHPVHLARVFRRWHGTTVAAYVRRLRFEDSLHQLRSLDRPLAEIARAAGFADQSHFSRAFRRMTGSTPKRYRDRLANG